jgi:kinetochore protein Mis12/MTW1
MFWKVLEILIVCSQNLSFSNQDNAPTPESINMQRKKLRETRKLQQALQKESQQNEAVIAQLKAALSAAQDSAQKRPVVKTDSNASVTPTKTTLPNLSFLTSGPAATTLRVGQNNSLTTNTDFVLSQLPALHAATQKLRAKLSTLSSTTAVSSDASKRDQRREYIDGRIRLHLERSGEPALGDGQAAIVGRKISGAEAQALEAVGSILNDGK